MGELARRVVVALIGAPLAVWVIWLGDAALATLCSALSALAAWEFYRIAREGEARPLAAPGIIAAAIVPLVVHARQLGLVQVPFAAPVLAVVGVLGATVFLRSPRERPLTSAAVTVLGVVYTAGTLSFAYALRYHVYAVGDVAGALVVLLPVLLTWASDVGAYATGRTVGGPKLMPSVSPGKTIAGAIGAVVTTIGVCAAFVHWALRPHAQLAFTPWGMVVFAALISVSAQVGDLAESLLKREAHVKDSGSIFPGHGGVLDRLDSLFFVLPTAFVLYGWLLVPAPAARP